MFVAVQKSLYEHLCVQVDAAWQVFPPPSTFCLHIVVSVRDSQSILDILHKHDIKGIYIHDDGCFRTGVISVEPRSLLYQR